MNKRGFTLIEIIICLALIVGIGTASTIVVVKNNNDNDKIEEITKKIVDAANIYINIEKDGNGNTYQYGILNGGKGVYISLETLVDKGYIKETYLDEIKKTGDTNLQLLAVNAKGTDGIAPCVDGDITYQVSWDSSISDIYLCPYSDEVRNNIVKITYDLNYPDGSDTKYTYNVEKGKDIELSLFNPVFDGHDFQYWKDETGNKITSTIINASNDIILTAFWEEKEQNNITKLLKYKDSNALHNKLVYGNWTTDCTATNKSALCFGYAENLTDNDEPVIYYKGNMDNNYLKIDGLNTVFRIARTVENGGVKIVEDNPLKTDIEYKKIKDLGLGCFYLSTDSTVNGIRSGGHTGYAVFGNYKGASTICMKNVQEIKRIYIVTDLGYAGAQGYEYNNVGIKYDGWSDESSQSFTITTDVFDYSQHYILNNQNINIKNPVKTIFYDLLNNNYSSKNSIMSNYIDNEYKWCLSEISWEKNNNFKCDGEKTLDSKFGLLTYNEYKMLSAWNNAKSSRYNNLYGTNIGVSIGNYGEFSMDFILTYYMVNSGWCDGCEAHKENYLRPAYVLKGNSKVISGDGTSSNPYIIKGFTN